MKRIAIIPSGGVGKRINSSLPKQYHKVKGKELIVYTLERFQKSDLIDEIAIAAQRDYFNLINNLKEKYSIDKLKYLVEGGKERQDSVFNALSHISAKEEDIIIVHDAARPLLPTNILTKALKETEKNDNIIIAIKAQDTLVKAQDFVETHIDRNSIFYVQTPQISTYKNLRDVILKAKKNDFYGTDESMLLRKFGYKIKIVEGSSLNFKITTEEDLKLFELLV